jgi:hypothetical protein
MIKRRVALPHGSVGSTIAVSWSPHSYRSRMITSYGSATLSLRNGFLHKVLDDKRQRNFEARLIEELNTRLGKDAVFIGASAVEVPPFDGSPVPGTTKPALKFESNPMCLAEALLVMNLEEPSVMSIGIEILRTLAHLHRNGVVHGDVCAETFFLGPDRVLTIPGLGTSVATGTGPHFRNRPTMIRWDTCAPEVASAAVKDSVHCPFAADVWAAGVLLVRIMYGVSLFHSVHNHASYETRCKKLCLHDPRVFWEIIGLPPSESPAEDAARDLISKMLSWDASERPSAESCLWLFPQCDLLSHTLYSKIMTQSDLYRTRFEDRLRHFSCMVKCSAARSAIDWCIKTRSYDFVMLLDCCQDEVLSRAIALGARVGLRTRTDRIDSGMILHFFAECNIGSDSICSRRIGVVGSATHVTAFVGAATEDHTWVAVTRHEGAIAVRDCVIRALR